LAQARISSSEGEVSAIASIRSDKDWRALLSYLPEGYEQLAHEHRVLNTQ